MATKEPKKTQAQNNYQPHRASRPNEHGTIRIDAHFRIFDPKTQKTYVEGRA